jgi:hypothetical protein
MISLFNRLLDPMGGGVDVLQSSTLLQNTSGALVLMIVLSAAR